MATEGGILAILDGNLQLTAALRRAVAFARHMNLPLYLYLFEDYKQLDEYSQRRNSTSRQRVENLLDIYLKERNEKLSGLAASLQSDDLKLETRVIWGNPLLSKILDAVLELKPKLVIKDVHSEPLLKRILFTPLDWHLLRQCPVPLMLVKTQEQDLPKRILAAVDPLDERGKPHVLNEQIMRAAEELSGQCRASLDVVHVMEFSSPLYYPDPAVYDDMYESHEDALKTLGLQFSIPERNLHLLEGETNSKLTQFVKSKQIDILVIGAVRRNGLNRAMLGSTAEDILDNIDCDILAVKPPEFSAFLIQELAQSPIEAA